MKSRLLIFNFKRLDWVQKATSLGKAFVRENIPISIRVILAHVEGVIFSRGNSSGEKRRVPPGGLSEAKKEGKEGETKLQKRPNTICCGWGQIRMKTGIEMNI